MNRKFFIVIAVFVLVSCGTQRQSVSVSEEVPQEPQAEWHTCLIQSAHATIIRDGSRLSSSITMQTVRDSLLVISATPLLGMEMLRVEATPTEVIVIDKIHGEYGIATYAEINRKLTPSINWDILQEICTAELPTGSDRARMQYMFGEEEIDLLIDYTPRQLDIPLRIAHQPLIRYNQLNIYKWL